MYKNIIDNEIKCRVCKFMKNYKKKVKCISLMTVFCVWEIM